MIVAPIGQNEAKRLEALRRYEVLDTLNTPEFDDFTRLASEACGVPIALISLIDADRQWFKSKVGIDANETPRDISFCAHAIQGLTLLEVPDALKDKRFFDNPLVTGGPEIRFYAGEPLISSDGFGIGTLCVADRQPRTLTVAQRDTLKVLGRLLVQQLELHLAMRREQSLNLELTHQILFRNTLLASAGMAIISTDKVGVITSFNPAAERLLGYCADEVIGQLVFARLHDSAELEARAHELQLEFGVDAGLESPSVFSLIVHKARFGIAETREWLFYSKYGTKISVELTMSPILDESGTLTGFLGLALDISSRKLLENTKAEFISTVSHELRTPLTSIRASLGLLDCGILGVLPLKAAELVKIANRNSTRLITIVNDILDMDKLLSGKMAVKTDWLDLVTLIEQTLEANAGYAQTYNVVFVLTNHALHRNVLGDANRLMQVMANLLSNAAKFSHEGGLVDIRILQQENAIRVEVQDYGDGIPPEFQSKIFGKFAQADTATTRRHGGTGLGLNISHKLIEKMHGKIGFTTVIGQGTTFWFTVPTIESQ